MFLFKDPKNGTYPFQLSKYTGIRSLHDFYLIVQCGLDQSCGLNRKKHNIFQLYCCFSYTPPRMIALSYFVFYFDCGGIGIRRWICTVSHGRQANVFKARIGFCWKNLLIVTEQFKAFTYHLVNTVVQYLNGCLDDISTHKMTMWHFDSSAVHPWTTTGLHQ